MRFLSCVISLTVLPTLPSSSSAVLLKIPNVFSVELTASGLRSPVPAQCDEEISFDDRKPVTPQPPSAATCATEQDDFEDTFSSLTRLAITTLYNCTTMFSGHEDTRETLLRSGALQVLWCTLLISNEAAHKQISLPVEALLNTFGCFSMLEKYYPGKAPDNTAVISFTIMRSS